MKQDSLQSMRCSTGCDEIGGYFATEADTMIDIVCEVDLKKDWF